MSLPFNRDADLTIGQAFSGHFQGIFAFVNKLLALATIITISRQRHMYVIFAHTSSRATRSDSKTLTLKSLNLAREWLSYR